MNVAVDMYSDYSQSQISQFLSYIQIPSKYHIENNPPRDINFLTALHTGMIAAVPYENLSMHYSETHQVSLDPQHLFRKIVSDARGRGGYCFEVGLFYNQVLRGLGFRSYPVGVRVRLRENGVPQGAYIGWVHIVVIVTLDDGSRWMVEIGFGGDGATKPLPLVCDVETRNIGTQDMRMIRDFIPGQTERSPEQRMWIYQYRNGPEQPWHSYYAFFEYPEWLPADFRVMNNYTSDHKATFLGFTVLIIKFLRRKKEDSSGEDVIFGKRMLVNGVVKENLRGKTTTVQECKTEEERVEALRRWFGLELTEAEKQGIKGRQAELSKPKVT